MAMSVHRLPDEILLEIFRFTQLMVKQVTQLGYAPLKCVPWHTLLHVCKRWSAVARNAPALWRKIDLWQDMDIALLRYSLVFSGEMPVDVRIAWPPGRLDAVTEVLSPSLHRVRSLKLRELNTLTDFSLTLLLYHPMPLLEKLSMGWDYDGHDGVDNLDPLDPNQREDEEGHPIRYPFFWFPQIDQYPRLVHLSLQRTVGFSLRFPVIPTLKRLDLSYCIVLGDIALADFLPWLAQHPALEELSLIRVPFSLVTGTSLRLPPTLRKFTLEDFPPYIAGFLLKMAPLPTDLNIHVIRRRRYLPPDNAPETPVTAVHSLPGDRAILPILSLVDRIVVRMRYWQFYSLIGRTSLGTVIGISAWIPDEPPDVLDFLDELRDAFGRAPVFELRVEGHGENRLNEARWKDALLAFPDLRTIAVTDTFVDEDDDFLDACRHLLRALRPSVQDNIPCAALVALELVAENTVRDTELVEEIAACLAARAARGAQLDELRILLKPKDALSWPKLTSWAEILQRRAVFIDALQHSVRVLHVEEWPGNFDPPGDDAGQVWC